MKRCYLDNAATTKVRHEVIDIMMLYMRDKWHNPSSLYSDATLIKRDVDKARKTVADFIHAKPDEIYFTSCGSESNCWAIQGFISECKKGYYTPVLMHTSIEHKSIMECGEAMAKLGVPRIVLSVDGVGYVDIHELITKLKTYAGNDDKTRVIVSVQMANNECGTIQDILNISNVVHMYKGCYLHVDAVQAFGQVNIDVNALGIDMLSASGHKIGTPKGIGFLYVRHGVPISPIIYGSQMDGKRGGTENVPYIMGFAKAVELAKASMTLGVPKRVEEVRNCLMSNLVMRGCRAVGAVSTRLPNNVCVILPEGCGGEEMVYMLDAAGIQASTGSACNSHDKKASPVGLALGLSIEEANRMIRFTLPGDGTFTCEDAIRVCDEVDKCIRIMKNVMTK